MGMEEEGRVGARGGAALWSMHGVGVRTRFLVAG